MTIIIPIWLVITILVLFVIKTGFGFYRTYMLIKRITPYIKKSVIPALNKYSSDNGKLKVKVEIEREENA